LAGVPLKAVQELLGHRDIKMTMRYAHMAPSALSEAVSKLDDAANSGHYLPTRFQA
jgi:site-specific recombinase XerD